MRPKFNVQGHTNNKVDQNKLTFLWQQYGQRPLPGFDSHLELTPYRANATRVQVPADARQGAVAVVIGFEQALPYVLLTKRADYKGVHGGQISFPGGKAETNDISLWHTAVRESQEETGIVLEKKHDQLALTPIYIPPSNFLVNPFLFMVDHTLEFTPNREVDYIIKLPLQEFITSMPIAQHDIQLYNGTRLKNAPCFKYNHEIIWGATAAILNELRWMLKEL